MTQYRGPVLPARTLETERWSRLLAATVVACVVAIFTGCTEGTAPMPASSNVQHAVTPPLLQFENSTGEERRAQVSSAIEVILSRLPAQQRAEARALLENGPRGTRWTAPASSSDPEIARQLGIITAVRTYEANLLDPGPSRLAEAADRPRVRVLVALDPSLKQAAVRALVVRSPGENGTLLVLLRAADATPGDLEVALKAAALSYRANPKPPLNELRIPIRASGTRSTAGRSAKNEKALDLLKTSNPYDIPGVGRLKAILMMTAAATQ